LAHTDGNVTANGSPCAPSLRMRTVVILVIVALLGCVFLAQKQREYQKVASTQKVPAQTASPRPVSEHNWMKHSLDTTNKVTRKVAEQRKEDGSR
jgi:hypothetical protein